MTVINIVNKLKSIEEPLSLDGIIKTFESEISFNNISKELYIFFIKDDNNAPKLWYKSQNANNENLIKNLLTLTNKSKTIEYENNMYAFPLIARNVFFGIIILKSEYDINFMNNFFTSVIDYLAILLYSEKLYIKASKDKLTNTYNKAYILDELKKLDENEQLYSIIMLDLDKFKHHNDTYGHIVGDFILRKSSFVIKKTLSEISTKSEIKLGRFGGEEFLILVFSTDKKEIEYIMEKIKHSIYSYDFSTEDYSLRLTTSLGASIKMKKDEDFKKILKNADDALYKSKNEGRNKFNIK